MGKHKRLGERKVREIPPDAARFAKDGQGKMGLLKISDHWAKIRPPSSNYPETLTHGAVKNKYIFTFDEATRVIPTINFPTYNGHKVIITDTEMTCLFTKYKRMPIAELVDFNYNLSHNKESPSVRVFVRGTSGPNRGIQVLRTIQFYDHSMATNYVIDVVAIVGEGDGLPQPLKDLFSDENVHWFFHQKDGDVRAIEQTIPYYMKRNKMTHEGHCVDSDDNDFRFDNYETLDLVEHLKNRVHEYDLRRAYVRALKDQTLCLMHGFVRADEIIWEEMQKNSIDEIYSEVLTYCDEAGATFLPKHQIQAAVSRCFGWDTTKIAPGVMPQVFINYAGQDSSGTLFCIALLYLAVFKPQIWDDSEFAKVFLTYYGIIDADPNDPTSQYLVVQPGEVGEWVEDQGPEAIQPYDWPQDGDEEEPQKKKRKPLTKVLFNKIAGGSPTWENSSLKHLPESNPREYWDSRPPKQTVEDYFEERGFQYVEAGAMSKSGTKSFLRLFMYVCWRNPSNRPTEEQIKNHVRESILETPGLWKQFARDTEIDGVPDPNWPEYVKKRPLFKEFGSTEWRNYVDYLIGCFFEGKYRDLPSSKEMPRFMATIFNVSIPRIMEVIGHADEHLMQLSRIEPFQYGMNKDLIFNGSLKPVEMCPDVMVFYDSSNERYDLIVGRDARAFIVDDYKRPVDATGQEVPLRMFKNDEPIVYDVESDEEEAEDEVPELQQMEEMDIGHVVDVPEEEAEPDAAPMPPPVKGTGRFGLRNRTVYKPKPTSNTWGVEPCSIHRHRSELMYDLLHLTKPNNEANNALVKARRCLERLERQSKFGCNECMGYHIAEGVTEQVAAGKISAETMACIAENKNGDIFKTANMNQLQELYNVIYRAAGFIHVDKEFGAAFEIQDDADPQYYWLRFTFRTLVLKSPDRILKPRTELVEKFLRNQGAFSWVIDFMNKLGRLLPQDHVNLTPDQEEDRKIVEATIKESKHFLLTRLAEKLYEELPFGFRFPSNF